MSRSCSGFPVRSPTTPRASYCRCCFLTPLSSRGGRPSRPTTLLQTLGALAQRRITDTVTNPRSKIPALVTQCRNYTPGNTDLSWTRLTPWRALLAAALDQYPARIRGGRVTAERANPSADLLAAWLSDRLHVPIERASSKGPGITDVALFTGGGEIEITRPDGRLASFSVPNTNDRPVALKRRDTAELLAEELRRLDPDDIYEATVQAVCRLSDADGNAKPPKGETNKPAKQSEERGSGSVSKPVKKPAAAKATSRRALS